MRKSVFTFVTTGTFLRGARLLGLNGAEIVFNPSATVAGLSQYLWKLKQPAHAVANGYFMGCLNRVGEEAPWNIGKFYGHSYFVDPFLELSPAMVSEMREALAATELERVELVTHKLGSSLATLCATPSASAAVRLEGFCRDGNVERALEAFADLESKLADLGKALLLVTAEFVKDSAEFRGLRS